MPEKRNLLGPLPHTSTSPEERGQNTPRLGRGPKYKRRSRQGALWSRCCQVSTRASRDMALHHSPHIWSDVNFLGTFTAACLLKASPACVCGGLCKAGSGNCQVVLSNAGFCVHGPSSVPVSSAKTRATLHEEGSACRAAALRWARDMLRSGPVDSDRTRQDAGTVWMPTGW